MPSSSPPDRAASPLPNDSAIIDVASHGPAILETRGRRALTLEGADAQGRFHDDDTSTSRSDEDDLEDDNLSTETEEHAYRRGRQAIPMESPGDEMRSDLLIDDYDDDDDVSSRAAGLGVQRLRRLRGRRGFFHSDGDARSFRYRSSGGILQRITLRRRKEGEHDVFWTAILVLTWLSFALMGVITIYLSQTDFFASHQNDLFGTTVDNRFTVVAEDDAQIFLKSGYSTSVYKEAMIAFDAGELQIGRRGLVSEETQDFYGVSFFPNGTASFTNRVDSPMIEADYLHAKKAVIFDDGTVMTTAANSSGGVKELGDLNLVSQSGAVVTSAGGKSLLFVDPEGTVTVADTESDDPTFSGIILDGTRGSIRIGGGLTLKHTANSSSLTTSQPLRLQTSSVLIGSPKSGNVRLTVADVIGSESDDGEAVEGEDGARALESKDDADENESITMEVAGQTTSSKKEGGDIRVVGGDGLEIGGDVILAGGRATESDSLEYGSVTINAGLDQSASSVTEIGSHSASHAVNVHGLVNFNGMAAHHNNATQVKVGGGRFNVSSQRITLDNRATSSSQLRINSNDLRLGASSPSIQVGKLDLSKVAVEGGKVSLDATKSTSIGRSSSSIVVGNPKSPGQVAKIGASVIELDASHSVSINTHNAKAVTTISGLVHFNGSSTTNSLMTITDTMVRVNPPKFRVGSKGKTSVASIEAMEVSIGGPGANATVLPPSGSTLDLSSASISIGSEVSATSLMGKTLVLDAVNTLGIGEEVESVLIGSESVGEVDVQGGAISLTGAATVNGVSLFVQSKKISIGSNTTSDITIGASSVKTAALEAKTVLIGPQAETVSVGVGSSTVNIGSDASVINLSGSVIINGQELGSRRLAGGDYMPTKINNKQYGFLDADRITVPVAQMEQLIEFPLRWDTGYSSAPQVFQVETGDQRVLSVASVVEGVDTARHIQVSLQVSSVLFAVKSDEVSKSSKIRCRIYRHTVEPITSPDAIALEVSASVEHCSSAACNNGVFVGLQGQRIVAYNPGDSFSARCAVASSAGGELVLQGVQYSFATMQQ